MAKAVSKIQGVDACDTAVEQSMVGQSGDAKKAHARSDSPADPSALDERQVRRTKRQALIDAHRDPYPIASRQSDYAADLISRYAALEDGQSTEDHVAVAGRIRAFRKQGKIAFIILQDSTASIQLFCRINELSGDDWELLVQLDVGDIVGAEGTVVRTRRGELSVMPHSLTLLAKSMRPLPEKFHGLSDKETRYRQRYADLIVNEDVRKTFSTRSAIVAKLRDYMAEEGYMEVETPILNDVVGGANAKPFLTHYNALGTECCLRIAPELYLKRLVVGGFDRVFEIGRCFRNEGMDLMHNPEFTSLEAYRAYSDLEGMKELCRGAILAAARVVCSTDQLTYQGKTINLFGIWKSRSMCEIASEVVGVSLTLDTPLERIREVLDAHEIAWDPSWSSGRLIAEVYDELGEGMITDPTFVCDYPVEVSPLAKRKDDDPRLTDRFELVIAGHEYANAFSELNDPVDQELRFAEQVKAKAAGDQEAMDYDVDYIRALEYGLPPTGGLGIGVDRLVMLLTNQASIRDVLLFPHMRPEGT